MELECESLHVRLRTHPLLSGLAERFSPEVVNRACLDHIGFPPEMVTTTSEAAKILKYCQESERDDA